MAIFKKLHKRSGVTWYYVRIVAPDGRRFKKKAGTTAKQARKMERTLLGQIASGEWHDPREEKKRSVTFGEFADRFLADYGSLRRSDQYTGRLRKACEGRKAGIMREYFGAMPLDKITPADLDGFSARRAREVGDSTRRKDLIVLGTLFKMAVRWKVLKASPAVDLVKPSEPRNRLRYLSRGEVERFKVACPPWLRPITTLAISTGMRLKEIVMLRWVDIDRQGETINVPEDTKTGTRPIKMGEAARGVFDGQIRHVRSPFIFLDSMGQPYTSTEARGRIGKATTAAMRRVGIEGATFSTLRHTAASIMVQDGTPLFEVQRILGHSTPTTTQRYAHLAPDFSKRGAAATDAVLLEGGPPSAPQKVVSS